MKISMNLIRLLIITLILGACTNEELINPTQQESPVPDQQFPSKICQSDEAMDELYRANPRSLALRDQFDEFTKRFVGNRLNDPSSKHSGEEIIIPVVFHVYGTDFAGKTVTTPKIITALDKVNEDFHGLNDDFDTVDPFFTSLRGTTNIIFKLAQIDPNGNPTEGVTYHAEQSGFGNGSGYDSQIQADAWDNTKYCNVYIQLDLYNNNQLNNSGVAWLPNQYMSDNNLARIVYNGRYLHGNTNKEFASTLSHEFGHWLNLHHTFRGGCRRPNEKRCDTTGDLVCDTPQTRGDDGCGTATNCVKLRINTENFMDYSGAFGCYKMFTLGQIDRMEAALQHSARITLWQPSNLTATGL